MISPIKLNLARKLKDKTYRHSFFRGRVQDEIAQRLRHFREMRNLSQMELAESCAMKQSAVSRIEQSSYSRWNLKTLWRIAEALDLRMRVIFEPMEDVIAQYKAGEERTPDANVALFQSAGQFYQGENLESLFRATAGGDFYLVARTSHLQETLIPSQIFQSNRRENQLR